VPQRAVLEAPGGNGKMVYLVGSDGKGGNIAQLRPVEVGDWVGDSWIVRSGLKPGDQVITEGMSKIFFPGAPVMLGPPPGAPAAAGAPGAGKGPAEAGKESVAPDAGKADAAKAAPGSAAK